MRRILRNQNNSPVYRAVGDKVRELFSKCDGLLKVIQEFITI